MIHPIKRARERFGVELTIADLQDLAKQCTTQTVMRVQPEGRTVHLVKFGDVVMPAVYDPELGVICSFMPHGLRKAKVNGVAKMRRMRRST